MSNFPPASAFSRRAFLQASALAVGTTAFSAALPYRLLAQAAATGAEKTDAEKIAAIRSQMTAMGIKVIPVAHRVWMIGGAGGNIGVVSGPEGNLLIDSGFSTVAPDVLKALRPIDGLPLRYLINTHWHFDHTEGNDAMHSAGATIMAHAKTRERLAVSTYVDIVKIHFPALSAGGLPTRTLTDGFTLYLGGDEISLQHVPAAHTDTDLYVHLKNANVIHAGDIFFNGAYPLIDYSTGGTINGYLDGMSKTLAVADDNTKIIPGHGPLASKADFQNAHDMLATIRDRVAVAKKAGKSLPDTIAAKPSADFDAKWGKGMVGGDGIVSLIYNTL